MRLAFRLSLPEPPLVPEQPWRHPRPAPELSELRARTPTPRSVLFVRNWWPALLWAAVIFSLSTDLFSAEHTGHIIEPILRWIYPSMSIEAFLFIHHIIRKSAHFTEYFIFCVLIYRGVRGNDTGWRWSWGLTALSIAAAYSALDEIHQAFVASRTASPYDSLLDSIGAFFAVAAIFFYFRLRPSQ